MKQARSAALGLAGLAIFGALGAIPAAAQLSSNGGPIAYSADGLEYFDAERKLILTGKVEVAQSDATLRADRLTLFFAPTSAAPVTPGQGFASNDIQRIFAEGNVYYIRPEQTAHGNQAVYEAASDTVTFSGNVVVASDENVIRGETMVLQVGGRKTTVKPGGAPGERVRGVFRTRGATAAPTPRRP
jgi:lipopolysaccharide export system protein LptA